MTAALDFGRASVKIVAERGGLWRCAASPVDPSLEGPARAEALIAGAKLSAQALGLKKGTLIHAAVPRALAIVKTLTIPAVPAAEVEALLRYQAAKILPFALDELHLAWADLGPAVHGGGVRYALGAVREDTLAELRRLIEAAGLRPGRLEISSQAAARSLALLAPTGEALALDVGHATSDVLLLQDGALLFSRSASVGVGGERWRARLTQEVVRSLVAARTEAGASERIGPPDRIVVSGGGAGNAELLLALSESLNHQAEASAPAQLCDPAGAPLQPAEAALFLVARGLLGPPGSVPRLDLAGQAVAIAARRSRTQLATGLIGAGLALALLLGAGYSYLDGRATGLAELEAERAQLEPAVKRAKALRDELRRVGEWDARKGRELEALHAISAALPSGERAYLTQLRWTEGQAVRLVGRAKDGASAEEFFSALEQDPRVASAQVEQIRQPTGKDVRGVEFSGFLRLVDPQRKVATK